MAGNHPSSSTESVASPTPVWVARRPAKGRFRAVLHRWREVVSALRPFAQRHWRRFWIGAVASLMVVAVRMTIPWLFKAMLKPLLSGNHNHRQLSLWLTNGTVEPTLLFGVLFLVLLVIMGFADFVARLKFAQYAIGMVRDLRAKAFSSAVQLDPTIRVSGPGDLVARLIGDTARVKEGLKGFLTHVATNGILLIGICVVLVWVDPLLGGVLGLAVAGIFVVTLVGAVSVYKKAAKYRAKEGKLADTIQLALRRRAADDNFALINNASGEYEATVTKIQGRATWATHAIFGLAVLVIVTFGMRAVAARRLATADMLLFILYVLMMRSPIVQMCRQGTRTGKIMACADRLEQVLAAASTEAARDPLPPLAQSIRMTGVRISRTKAHGRARRLTVASLEIAAGSKVALVGPAGSGKSTFLQLIAGGIGPYRGMVTWDQTDLADISAAARLHEVTCVSQDPSWPKQPLWQAMGLTEPVAEKPQRKLMKKLGAWLPIKRLPGGLASRLGSERFSSGERRAMAMVRAAHARGSVLLMDDPVTGMSEVAARKAIKRVLGARLQATAIVAMSLLPEGTPVDRVIGLCHGKIVFDGSPEAWVEHLRAAELALAVRVAAAASDDASGTDESMNGAAEAATEASCGL